METRSAGFIETGKPGMRLHPSVSFTKPVRVTIIYYFVMVAAALVCAWVFTMNSGWGLASQVKKILYVAALLLIGTGHLIIFPNWFPQLYNQDNRTRLIYSLILTMLIGVATFLLFGFAKFENLQLSITAAFAFLFPTAVLQSWNSFDSISPVVPHTWYIPPAAPPEKKASIYLNSLQVTVKIKINYYDIQETAFMITVPGRLQMGNIFHQFLIDREQESNIELVDQHHRPYAWRFSLQKPLGNKELNPELTLIDNRIRQKDTILAERISTT
ncbi:MAG: TssN family type VI secretion system protein [Ferruginibacter sp.]